MATITKENLLHAPSRYCRRWQATADDCALRYYGTFVKIDGAWLFAERLLYVDWIEERILS